MQTRTPDATSTNYDPTAAVYEAWALIGPDRAWLGAFATASEARAACETATRCGVRVTTPDTEA